MLLKEVSKKMRVQGHGKMVNISSIAGIVAKNKASAYSSSKAGLAGLTRAIAVDMAQFGVLVNSVSPGPTETDMVEKLLSVEEKETICNNIPLRRLAHTTEIANVVLFLSSNLNTYITGQNIVVDGGFTIT
jgi:NAD(P)-dependent dehydrogenase (short-subunit alcohol dehydrogenase family)